MTNYVSQGLVKTHFRSLTQFNRKKILYRAATKISQSFSCKKHFDKRQNQC